MTDLESTSEKKYPCVVIAGRPNVGKSTLFNRFLRQRRAITDPVPGVTRDPISGVCDLAGRKIKVTDTGGIDYSKEGFASLITEKSLASLTDADLILLLLEGKELNSEDEHIIHLMRKYTDKIFLVVNKLDSPEKDDEIWNYHSLGFKKVIGISSAHGRNIDTLVSEMRKFLDEKMPPENDIPDETPAVQEENARVKEIKISIIGKPNTGKSTLINCLTGKDMSIISDVPGTTRDVIEGQFEYRDIKYTIYDTAGIRRKKMVKEDIEYYSVNRAIKSIDYAEVVLLMVDCVEGLTDQDKKIAYQIVKKGRGVVIVLNKWDMVKQTKNTERAMKDRLEFLFPILDFAPVVTLSAKNGEGIDKLLDAVFKVKKQLFTRVSTSDLNKALREWVEDRPIPAPKGIRYKIRYATQPEVFPTKFILFVNKVDRFPAAYISYVKNMIRKRFRVDSIPFDVELRETSSDKEDE